MGFWFGKSPHVHCVSTCNLGHTSIPLHPTAILFFLNLLIHCCSITKSDNESITPPDYCTDMTNPVVIGHKKICHHQNLAFVTCYRKICCQVTGRSLVTTRSAVGLGFHLSSPNLPTVSDPWINHDLFMIFHTINSVLTAQARII
jgi:hypothetical protein